MHLPTSLPPAPLFGTLLGTLFFAGLAFANDAITEAGGLVRNNAAGTAVSLERLVEYGPFGQPRVVRDARITPAVIEALKDLDDLIVLSVAGHKVPPDLVEALPGFTKLRVLDLKSTGFTNAQMARLADLRQLERLSLEQCRGITDEGLRHLAGLTKLKQLNLHSTRVSDQGLLVLKDHKNLERLKLRFTNVLGAGLAALSEHPRFTELEFGADRSTADKKLLDLSPFGRGFPALKTVRIGGNQLGTATHLKWLARLPALETLELNTIGFLQVSDEGLKQFTGSKTLKSIGINGATNVSDAGVKTLCGIPTLESLNLGRTGITGNCAEALAGLPALRSLTVVGTRFDPKAVQLIKARHPKAAVTLHQIMH